MKRNLQGMALLLTGIMFSMLNLMLIAQDDDPNIDRIPDDFIQHQQNSSHRNVSSVITIDGYDNYYLGTDFAEGHISENPLQAGEYFTAFNIDDIHYSMDGHDWVDGSVSWGGYYIRGDVLTAYDASGNLYYENMYGSSIQGCVVVKSSDNGATWSTPVVAISGNDKNWMTADQTSGPYSNYVYTTMTNSGSGNFARSIDQGVSFQNTSTFGTQYLPGMMVCIGAWGATDGGAVYVVTNSGGSFNSTYTFYQSLDGGQSFTQMSSQSWAGYVGSNVNGRNSVENMRTRPYPFITADNSNGTHRGRLYIIYASNEPAGNGSKPDILSRYSDDGGINWSAAVTVNDDSPSTANNQWHPATWCDYETGRLYVQWMDTRDTPTADSALIYATYSDDGGQTFVPNHAVSNVKMKINCSSCGGGGTPRYQGDYNSIISNAITSMPAWSDFRDGSFKTFTGYFPDYALDISPSIAPTSGGIATFDAEIPSVKAWTELVSFTASMDVPSTGSFNINYPNGNSLSTFPDTLPIEVSVVGNVPPGMYGLSLTATGPNGTPIHIRTATVEVIATPPPVADFSADETSICAGNVVNFTDLSSGSPTNWLWTFPGGIPPSSTDQNPTGIVYDVPGMYDVTLEATNNGGSNTMLKTDYIEVLAGPAAPVSEDDSACFGSIIPELTAIGVNIQWYDDAALTNLVYTGSPFPTGHTDPGEYTYYVTQSDLGCESAASMVTLTIFDLPIVTLDAFDPLCIDAPPLTLSGGSPTGGTYTGAGVAGGIFDPAIAGAGTHPITYTYMDTNGCENMAVQDIEVNSPSIPDLGPDQEVCATEIVVLDANNPNIVSYEWYPGGQTTAQISVDSTGVGIGSQMYIVSTIDNNACNSSDSLTVTFEICPGISELPRVNNILLYPNPGQGSISLQIDINDPLDLNIKIYNNRGVSIYEENGLRLMNSEIIRLDLSDQAAGIYLLMVYNNEGKWVEKLVIRD